MSPMAARYAGGSELSVLDSSSHTVRPGDHDKLPFQGANYIWLG